MKSANLSFFLAILVMLACGEPAQKEIQSTIINGKITRPIYKYRAKINGINFENIEKNRKKIGLVSNAIRSGLDVPNQSGILDKDGNFHFIIKIDQPTELRLKYHFKSVPLYAEPGDEIKVDIDFTKEGNPHTISGGNVVMNKQFSAYDQLFRDSFQVELNATLSYAIPREFKSQRTKITKRIRRVAKDFIEKNAKDNVLLANWVKHHSEYRIAMDYMKYAFKVYGFNQFSPDLKEGFPEAYFDFWEEFPVNNPEAISSLNYQNYLQLYRKYLMSKLRHTTPYQDCINFPNCNEFEMEIAQLTNQLKGKTKDLVLSQQVDYQLIRNNASFLEKGLNLYLDEISDSTIIDDLLARKEFLYGERPFEFPKNATLFQTDGTGAEILQNISTQHLNKTTLLYFWNTQRKITSFYESEETMQRVWKSLDSIGFELVLLAHHSTPNVWKEKIVEKGLIRDQWHLTDKQFSFFEDFFHESRKPHPRYDRILDRENFMLLVDENGNLGTMDAIQIRETNFFLINHLSRFIKYHLLKQQQQLISAEN